MKGPSAAVLAAAMLAAGCSGLPPPPAVPAAVQPPPAAYGSDATQDGLEPPRPAGATTSTTRRCAR